MEPKSFAREDNPFEDPKVAETWIESVESERGLFRDQFIYPLVEQWLGNESVRRVLDVGAGQGIAATLCKGKEYVGLEPSEKLVRRAIEQYGNLGHFVQGSIYELPFQDHSFDAVFAINVWFHLKNIGQASQEIARVLETGGQGLIINPNPDAYDTWRGFYENSTEFNGGFEGRASIPGGVLPRNIFYTHPQEAILHSFESAGLHVVETSPFAPLESGQNLFAFYKLEKRDPA